MFHPLSIHQYKHCIFRYVLRNSLAGILLPAYKTKALDVCRDTLYWYSGLNFLCKLSQVSEDMLLNIA